MSQNHYIVLDAAKMQQHLETAKRFNPRCLCLYSGDAEKKLQTVAPWLFSFPKETTFREWYLARGGQQYWGIILQSEQDLKTVYKHLKKFLIIKTEAGKRLYFRFYDPRVLPTFLETSNAEQLKVFFGPIEKYILEVEKGEIVEYTLLEGKLTKNQSKFFFEDNDIERDEEDYAYDKNHEEEDYDDFDDDIDEDFDENENFDYDGVLD